MSRLIETKVAVLRTSLVIAALFSLCVSSNVGPRFLPLPALESAIAGNSLELQNGTTVSNTRSDEPASFRVPMAQAQKRDRTPQSGWLAAMPGVDCVVACEFRVIAQPIDPKTSFTSVSASPSGGRAPPVISKLFTV